MEKLKRNTKAKQLIMSVLANSPSALCYDDFERRIPARMDKATVYRILQGFCDDGVVHKISGENGKTYYALCHHCSSERHNDSHLHFRCVRCATILCMDEPISISPLPSGYTMLEASCLVSGYCPDCLPLRDEKHLQPTKTTTT
ncbi:MAG: transcriptional repressor [Prevotellaceae bacterium]|jgi:Fe2+ or Zn2+ uptake regulation protein|nr:transcriptional repressor [Prevotellaceae bacterium]